MKRTFSLLKILIICFLFISCKNLPVIDSANSIGSYDFINPFPKKKTQFTHSIKAKLPNGDNMLLIGITIVDQQQSSIQAVLMSIEGLVLLNISYIDNEIKLNRTLPSFDSADFAKALIDDLKLIYFPPEGKYISSGKFNGKYIKRFANNINTIDIIEEDKFNLQINKYDNSASLIRTAKISFKEKESPAQVIELTAPGLFGYSLYMELIDFELL